MNKFIFLSKNDEITFGKYKGNLLSNIAKFDPSYILWMSRQKNIEVPNDIRIKACENLQKESSNRKRNLEFSTGDCNFDYDLSLCGQS